MNEVLISVIIPVYNAEKYINHCMESILNQTFTKFEVILVDDGSTDDSAKLCDNYAENDQRIRIIHKANGGVSSARNLGMEEAIGEYIAFIDADDTLDADYLEILYANAVKHDVDISCCDCTVIEPSKNNKVTNSFRLARTERWISGYKELLVNFFEANEFYGYVVWGKIIKRELAILEKMEPLKYGEDTLYMLKLFFHNPTIYLDNYKGYNYIRWDDSATVGVDVLRVDRLRDGLLLYESILKYCVKSSDVQLADMACQAYAKKIYADLLMIIERNDREKYNLAQEILLAHTNKVLKLNSIGEKYRIMLLLYKSSPNLYWKLVSAIHKKDKKKHAVIVTIYDPLPNYGNRLQNYAVQDILRSCNINNSTISYENGMPIMEKIKYYIQVIFQYKLSGNKLYWQFIFPRKLVFEKFNKRYINTQHITDINQIKRADYYVLGSDQVWNTVWYHEGDMKKDLFLLTFCRPEQKVCFAPSFGTEHLPEKWKKWFQENLYTFPALNVREEAGQRIIKELTGQNAEVLIDPTMMLNKDDWLKIAKKPKKIDTDIPYILTYFLGERTERVKQTLKQLAQKYECRVYNLLDITQPEVYVTGPSEFIYMVSRSKLVLTDSFHASVFSFLFEKPFLVYPREGTYSDMMSRIDTLLKKFHLERKYIDSGLQNDLMECDYKKGYAVLTKERQKVMNYLKTIMNIR